MKYAWIALAAVVFVLLLFGGSFAGLLLVNIDEGEPAQKVVLMIGDGMGTNHIACAEEDYGLTLNMKSLKYQGFVQTASLSQDEGLAHATDSAAASTAMARGKSVYNGSLIATTSTGEEIKSITKLAKEKGYGVGIVSSDYLCGATPAAFSASEQERYNYASIRQDQYASGIDLFLGADYDDDEGENYYAQEKNILSAYGYTYVNSYSSLSLSSNKIFGAFESVSSKHQSGVDSDLNPLLSELTTFAIKYMESKFPDGYFLMIEGAGMDKEAHSWTSSKDTAAGIDHLADFDKSVGIVKDKFGSVEGNCALIVTADHETGAMKYDDDDGQYAYYSHQHTNWDVPYFIQASSCKLEQTIKNTKIFTYMKEWLAV